jgi:5,10-methylenetetrahydromethanopterin reductase
MFAIELTPEAPVSTLAEYAGVAEDAGFDAVVASGHYNNRDQFQALTAMADATADVAIGPGVANPYETHPVSLASRTATLEEFSDGRALFGVGAGDAATLRNLGVERERPLRRVLETVQVARRLWAGERVSHDGTFRADDAGLNYDAGDVPVYVGAQGPPLTRMAAKYADGVFYNGAHPDDLAWASDRVAEGLDERAEERNVGGDDFEFLAYALTSVAESAADARNVARRPVSFVAGSAPDAVLDRHDIDRERASDIGDRIAAGAFREADDLVTDRILEAFCVAGTPATVAERIDALRAHVDGIVFASPLGPDVETGIRLLADARERAERA